VTHTPAPWNVYIGEGEDIIAVTKWLPGPNGGHFACELAKMAMPKKYLSQQEINDNGRLMRAAPDLLSALREAREALEMAGNYMQLRYGGLDITAEARHADGLKYRAALVQIDAVLKAINPTTVRKIAPDEPASDTVGGVVP